jgi:putative heme-binding domain-containing protein
MSKRACLGLAAILVATAVGTSNEAKAAEAPPAFEGEKTAWHGFDRYDFVMDEASLNITPFQAPEGERDGVGPPAKGQRRCIVVVPRAAAPGRPWSWQACYWNHEPQAEVELLRRGFHIAFITPDPGRQWDAWYAFLTGKHGLSPKPAFVGMSRGGVNEYDWATANPDKVSCIYADNPAIRPETFNKLGELASHDVPLLNVCGSFDFLLERHTLAIEDRYHQLGGRITVLIKEGAAHHRHSLIDPKLIADWIEQHARPAAPRPEFADDSLTKSYYYGLESSYRYLPEEKTYATCRGPGFTECYDRYDARTKSQWGITGMAVIVPSSAAPGKPWVFRAGALGREEMVDRGLLARGFHVVIAPLTAQSGAVREQWDATYKFLTERGFSRKPVLEGTGSAAGEAYAWAIENPEKVACIYGRNPVLRSLMSKTPPLENLAPLAKAGVPLIHDCGSLDPWLDDQTRVVEKRYKQLGGTITVFINEGEGHFPVARKDPKPVVDLILGYQESAQRERPKDAKHVVLDAPAPAVDEDYQKYGIYEQTAARPAPIEPRPTTLPLTLAPGARIALIGNTLLERAQEFGHFEALLQQRFPRHQLVVRHLAWSADTVGLQPRPANFADTEQHLRHERADVIFAAFGFNESFAGEAGLEAFRRELSAYVAGLKSKAFNGKSAPRVVLVSPIANENIAGVAAADRNNPRIRGYIEVMRDVARQQQVGFADVFTATEEAMRDPGSDLTINGIHLTQEGDWLFSETLYRAVIGEDVPTLNQALRAAIVDKNRQFFRRFRPLNTFYYTGGRNKAYGYLDFLPAMRNFDLMVANRDRRIWELAQGKDVAGKVDDSNVPPLPKTIQTRGVNPWLSAEDELKAFKVDPRFEVNLFAGEEQFPDIVNPIQMRWDSRGRLWVSCSTTYPHVYPGNEPNDKLVILEDTDGDGRADRSSVFADDLHIPLSFEFGDGGVYVSDMPHLTFLKDTDGDGKADIRQQLLAGFGTEDSHHALHDFTWTPDGDLIFRESVFHHSQVETPYGPVRQQNSGWYRFTPGTHRLISFGTYNSTNPWGVTFDDWGQHVASHPVYAAAFHALDPPYPDQHPAPRGLRAYSGTCGHEFVDFATFPDELQGGFIKVRYKPTNRVEIHKWREGPFGYDEEYVGDLLFSTNLSFIPVDLQFGPRGDLYVCDWYNPVKGHMQYSLRDERRDRHSGRIWRITTKGRPLQDPPRIAGASITELLELLKRPEYRYRYWAKRELREREPEAVKQALDAWVEQLRPDDPRFRHHQVEALWTYRWIGAVNPELLRAVLACDDHHARAAATQQLRYWHAELSDVGSLLRASANDSHGIVRMEAVIAASYIGTNPAFEAALDVLKHPRDGHLAYAIQCAFGSHTLRPYWEGKPQYAIARLLKEASRENVIKEPSPGASEAQFDGRSDLKRVDISCIPERMLFTVDRFAVMVDQPVKLVFTNPDATDHNLVIVKPEAMSEVGMAANEMARDPRNANSDFIPPEKRGLILQATPMIGPTRSTQVHVLRFRAPAEPGLYPFVCTFPGHWVVMNGVMVVAKDLAEVDSMLAAARPPVVKAWAMADFADFARSRSAHGPDEPTLMRGMQAFVKARCNQCHVVAGHGVNLGPDLAESVKTLKGEDLLRQIIEPSSKIHEKFQNYQIATSDGRIVTGVIVGEDASAYQVVTNLLTPHTVTRVKKEDVDEKVALKISPMPEGLVNVLTREEILDLHAFVESGGYRPPEHLRQHHDPR